MKARVVTKNQKPTERRAASSTAATSTVPTMTWVSVTGCTPSQRSVSSCAFTNTQAQVTSEATAHAQSSRVIRGLGFFSLAANSRKASGSRNSRCIARISRGSHTPAYAVQMWNRAAAAAQPPTAQPTAPSSFRTTRYFSRPASR